MRDSQARDDISFIKRELRRLDVERGYTDKRFNAIEKALKDLGFIWNPGTSAGWRRNDDA